MAPIGESCHLPPLDKCLDGRHQLLSWKTVFQGLSQANKEDDEALKKYLIDGQTIELLKRPFSPYSSPTLKTKANFETKTSAINVSPSTHGSYDIKQIKDDALWLSKETDIDEVAALRITILEWQTRPANRLLNCDIRDDRQDYMDVAGFNGLQSSNFDPHSSTAVGKLRFTEIKSFDDNGCRHQRLLLIYLSERRYLIRTCEFVVFLALFESLPHSSKDNSEDTMGKSQDISEFLVGIGHVILAAWNLNGLMQETYKHFTVHAVEALQLRYQNIQDGSGWLRNEADREQIEQAWGRNQVLEMLHIMQLLLTLLLSLKEMTRSDTVIAWFRLMKEHLFFEDFEPACIIPPDTYNLPFQSLVALISLASLSLPVALETIEQVSSSLTTGTSEESQPYLLNITGICEINEILTEVAAASLTNSCLAVLAWSSIFQRIREYCIAFKETREVSQSATVADKYGMANSLDTNHQKWSEKGHSISRRSTASSENSFQPTFLEEILDKVMNSSIAEDPIGYLARSALDGSNVFDVIGALATEYCSIFMSNDQEKLGSIARRMLLDLIRTVLDWIDYQPTLVNAVLAVLTGNSQYWEILDRPLSCKEFEPATFFLSDDLLMQKLFYTSLARFPYEILPFLRISKALSFSDITSDEGLPGIFELMQNYDILTSVMPPTFSAYEIIQEDEESSYIQLTSNLNLFDEDMKDSLSDATSQSSMSRGTRASGVVWDSQELTSGTSGRVASESKPLVVKWHCQYSPLRYLGKKLQSASMNSKFSLASSGVPTSCEGVSEIIDLLSIMLSSKGQDKSDNQGNHITQDVGRKIVEYVSEGLDRNQDIVSVIFQIFENELYKFHSAPQEGSSFDILLRCIHFIHALLSVMPDRVWSILTRSSLLGIGGVGTQFNTLVASSEMLPGYFSFLLGCSRLFDALVENAIVRATSGRVATMTVTRFGTAGNQGSGVSHVMMEKILNKYQQFMMSILESQQSWKLVSQDERFEISHWICSAFVKILLTCYAIDDKADTLHKIARTLIPAADSLIDSFRSASYNSFNIHALSRILLEGANSADTSLSIRGMQYSISATIFAIDLVTTLIRVDILLGRAPQYLVEHMFKASPILIKLYASYEGFRLPIVNLFEALVSSAANIEQLPPSLLGYLGELPARSFLEMLSIADQPFSDDDLSIGIWRLLSTIISRRQQWFAIFVLTGDTPRGSLKGDKNMNSSGAKASHTEPPLAVALDGLSNLERLNASVAIAMLEFAVHAADYWPWVLNTMEDHPNFLGVITDYIAASEKNLSKLQDRAQEASADYDAVQITSLTLEIIAMHINHTPKVGDSACAKTLVPILRSLAEKAVSVASYNASLHGNLRRNFESRFPGSTISQFKRSILTRPTLGASFYYDFELATKVLSFDRSWVGRRRGQGFSDELLRANVNLSLVESQVNLLRSWKFLSVELSWSLGSDVAYQRVMIATVIACLQSNVIQRIPETVFQDLAMSRGELAFSLLQRLYEVKSTEDELMRILLVAWDAVRDNETDLGLALSGPHAGYCRILLKILTLSLQSYIFVSSSPSRGRSSSEIENANRSQTSPTFTAATQVAVEIFGVVVTQGFRSLTTLLHDDPTRLLPDDLALIISISRAILHMPDMGKHITQLLSYFSDHQTARYASALLSWSDQISTDHDPVYAELSISFLLSLSNMPALAESLAVEGLLTFLSSTNLVNYLRQKVGIGPFDNPTRLYSIWYRGLLPLLLNLLTAVGAPIASEIACTVNSFPAQLSRASNTFAIKPLSSNDPKAGSITLSMALEIQSLAMILKILDSFREAGPSAGVDTAQIVKLTWDQAQVKDDLEHWMQRRASIRSRIVPTNEKEEAWMRQPPLSTTSEVENRLEEKVLEEMKVILNLLNDNDQ